MKKSETEKRDFFPAILNAYFCFRSAFWWIGFSNRA